MTELEKALKRLKISLKTVPLAVTPARGFAPKSRLWRASLSREVGEEKPLRLTMLVLSENAPTASNVIRRLIDDIEAGDLNLWEFAQEFNEGTTNPATEDLHTVCKRVRKRVERFFGDSWGKIVGKVDL